MEGFCRACFIKYDEPSELLQYTERNRRLFVYSTNLQVKRNDTFPFQLCKDCFINMKMACKFKKLCRTSDKRLKNYLALKDVGESGDFSTFLKNSDDTLTFRFPPPSGNSTPANHKNDDNESTCTSIRNFMTDILQGAEMPDSEARIIREVIEEEADILDDSLDSHWMQDDVSVDTDFGFSPFSTPRTVNNDHCYTPKKLDNVKDDGETLKYFSDIQILKDNGTSNLEDLEISKDVNEENYCNALTNDNEYHTNFIKDELERGVEISNALQGKKHLNFYTEDLLNEPSDIKHVCSIVNDDVKKCTIDRNLEEALKNNEHKEFSLDDLLVSPPGISAASTPTIRNILFGEKLDAIGDSNTALFGNKLDVVCDSSTAQFSDNLDSICHGSPALCGDKLDSICQGSTSLFGEGGVITVDRISELPRSTQCKEQYDNEQGESILDDFFVNDVGKLEENFVNIQNEDIKTKNIRNEDINSEDVNDEDFQKILQDLDDLIEYDLESGHCFTCEKKFKNPKALKIHLTMSHKITVPSNKKDYIKNYKYSYRTCEYCGEQMPTYRYYKHKKNHLAPGCNRFDCAHCTMSCVSKHQLIQHLRTHGFAPSSNLRKMFVCPTCGSSFGGITNFKIHMARHKKQFKISCPQCGRGFYRVSDYDDHYRTHTGERPFQCEHCSKSFPRRTALLAHVKRRHSAEKRFKCDNCDKRYKKKAELTRHTKNSKFCRRIAVNKARAAKASIPRIVA